MYKLDIGGTNLRLYHNEVLVDSKPINGNINLNQNLITEIIDYFEQQHITSDLLIGIAGYNSCSEQLKANLNNSLSDKISSYKVISDAEYHAMQLITKDDLLISLGTGSVASFYQGDEFKIIGGYGHVLGDIGSGYHFGKLCITTYLNDFEAGRNANYMSKIEKYFNTKGRGVLTKVIANEKSVCSELSGKFMDDFDFQCIFTVYFEQFLEELKRYMDISQKQTVVVNGAITKSSLFQSELKKIKLNIKIK